MVNIEIDGKKVKASDGAMLIEAADEAGIYIPRFCYHQKLSVAANCRRCLVEVEKARKPLPACATPVTEGMKIYTRSPQALAAQKGVMEFLLINHPLDCPICDQGGECELQDVAMGYGKGLSRYAENKRVVADKNLGPLISTEMTRCIHCTRCVRFGEEVAGLKELGATGRGEHMEIGTYVERTVDSEMSGNVIDLCPVGALTSKPFRFSARAWEMIQRETIAPHDCVGSNLSVHTRGNEVMRVAPRENEEVNETWISDRDRFSYEALNGADRLTRPMIKTDGVWQDTDWETALSRVASGLADVISRHGAAQVGFLAQPSSTAEELYLLQKLARRLGSQNIDHRLRQWDFSDDEIAPALPGLGVSIAALDNIDAALVIGGNLRKDQPILGHRLRKAALNGAKISIISAMDQQVRFTPSTKTVCRPSEMVAHVAGVAKALAGLRPERVPAEASAALEKVKTSEVHAVIAADLAKSSAGVVLLGMQAMNHPQFSALRAWAGLIAELSNSHVGHMPAGANGVGGWSAGALPHREAGGKGVKQPGLNARSMLEAGLKAYVLLGLEPEHDCAASHAASNALKNAEFVVALSAFRSPSLEQAADVMLPSAPFSETSGTFINVEGRWQMFEGLLPPRGEARPAWKVLRVLGNMMDLDGFDFMGLDEVHDELQVAASGMKFDGHFAALTNLVVAEPRASSVERVGDVPIYGIDAIVRRGTALQATFDAVVSSAFVNAVFAQRNGFVVGEKIRVSDVSGNSVLPVAIDACVPDGCVYIPMGVAPDVLMGSPYGEIRIEKL